MQHKLFCFLLCLLLFQFKANSQANVYHPFAFDQHPEWRVDHHDPYYCGYGDCGVCYKFKYSVNGDTVINSLHYYKIYFQNFTYSDSEYKGAVREDTLQKKIYVFYKDYSNEELLYDFDLQIGDTLSCNYGQGYGIVESIDSVLIAVTEHRRINFVGGYFFQTFLIEGIGCNTGLFEAFGPNVGFETIDILRCFRLNNFLQFEDTASCTEYDNALSTNQLDKAEGFYFPNPVDKTLTLHFSLPIESLTLYTTD